MTLKGAKASEVWDPEAKETEDYQGGHKLIIKQALLGPEAAEGEVNVLQVEAKRWPTWKKPVQIPVAVLKGGSSNSQVLLDLSFPDPPVTFSLAQGSGPVHIIGHHLIGSPIEEFEEMDEMEEEMLEDEESEEGAVSSFAICDRRYHLWFFCCLNLFWEFAFIFFYSILFKYLTLLRLPFNRLILIGIHYFDILFVFF